VIADGKLVRDTSLPQNAKLRRAFLELDAPRYHPRVLLDMLGVKQAQKNVHNAGL